ILTIPAADKATYEGIYTLTVTEGTCESSLNHNVVLHTNPDALPGNGGDVCLGEAISLLGNPADMISYTWTNAGGDVIGTEQNISVASADYGFGTHVFTLTVEDVNGCSGSATTSVTVFENPTAAPTFNAPVCDGGELVIAANAAGGTGVYDTYIWTKDGNPYGGNQPTITIDPASATDAGVYGVTVIDSNGCSSQETTVTVTIQALPVPTINGEATETSSEWCDGEDVTLTGGGGSFGASYSWLLPDGTTQNTAVLTITNADKASYEGIYTLTITEGTCESSLNHNVVLHTNPDALPGNGGDVCLGETISLLGNPADMISYTWTNAGGDVIGTEQNISVASADYGVGTHVFTLTVEDGNGCSGSATTSVQVSTVDAAISVSAPSSGVRTVCAGTSVTFNGSGSNGSGNYTYTFRRVRGADDEIVQVAGTSSTYVAAAENAPIDGDQFYVVVTDTDTGCSANSESITINVVSNPVPTLTISNNEGSSIICEGEELSFVATPSDFARYVFSIRGTPIQDGASSTFSYSGFVDGDVINVTAYTDLSDNPCYGTSSNLTIQVNQRPMPEINGSTTVCVNSTEVYEANISGLGKGNYTWNINGGTPTGDLDDETVEVVWDGAGPYSIELNYVNNNNCMAEMPTVLNITVNTVTATLLADNTNICSGEDVTFTASGGETYEFFVGTTSIQGPDANNTFTASGLTDGQVVTVRAIDAIGCEDTSEGIQIAVSETPNPIITSGPDVVCNGEEVTYTAEGGFVNYVWSVSDGGTITTDPTLSSVNVKWETAGEQSVSVAYASAGGTCIGNAYTLPVTVNALPSATSFIADPSNNVIIGSDITFTATGGEQYAFFVNDLEVQARSESNVLVVSTETPSANPIVTHGDVVRVNIYNAAGCSVFQEITVGVYDGIGRFDVIASSPGHCHGESIASISLSDYQEGITYELFRVGTPDVSLGKVLATASTGVVQWLNIQGGNPASEFKVVAYYDGTPPTPPIEMNNTVTVEEYDELGIYQLSVTPAEVSCGSVVTITLSGSDAGVIYHLLNGQTIVQSETGTGGVLPFENITLSVGTYTIMAEQVNAGARCEVVMDGQLSVAGDVAIEIYDIIGTKEGKYCDDGVDAVTISLSNSQSGYDYELYYNNAPIAPDPVIVSGTDAAISFGQYTAEGDYSVIMVANGCTYYMHGSVTVERVALPVPFNLLAEDNGHYCADDADGVELYLDAFEPGVEYHLYLDGNPVGTTITGTASFGSVTQVGEYSVIASTGNPSACTTVASTSVNVVRDNLPVSIALQGATEFCENGEAQLFLVEPEQGVEYELIFNDVATGDMGTVNGARIEWTVNQEGTYKVQATKNNSNTNCGPHVMPGQIELGQIALPLDKTVDVIEGDPLLCEGTVIKVIDPQATMQYAVVSNITGEVMTGYIKLGTDVNADGDIEFDAINDNGGSYRVEAYNGNCPLVLDMTGLGEQNEIIINNPNAISRKALQIPDAICEGDGAVDIVVLATDVATKYDLYRVVSQADIDPSTQATDPQDELIATIEGDGTDKPFANILKEGVYYVLGYNETLSPDDPCSNEMLNRVTIEFNRLPISYRLVGSGISCGSANPAVIGIEGSELGVEYTLVYDDPSSGKEPVATISGDGSPRVFNGVTQEGVYTVYARSTITGCTSSMEGEVIVKTVSEVGDQVLTKNSYSYCSNEDGAELVLQDQEYDVLYSVIDANTGDLVVSNTGVAAGSPLVLGTVPAGTYEVWGSFGDNCENQINNKQTVVVRSEPLKPVLSASSTEYCFDREGVQLTITNSQSGIGYQLIAGAGTGEFVGYINGNDASVTFPNRLIGTETYVVRAVSFSSGCEIDSDPLTITKKDELYTYNVILEYGNGDEGFDCVDKSCYGLIQTDSIKLDMSTDGVFYMLMLDGQSTPVKIVEGTGGEINFGVQADGGTYYVVANYDGCESQMAGSVELAVQPLVAVNDIQGLDAGEAIAEFDVARNDVYLANFDFFPKADTDEDKYVNLNFEVIPSWEYFDSEGEIQQFETIGEASINNEGKLEYKKRPNFFGKDSVRYKVFNKLKPERSDIATVFIFIGNISIEDKEALLLPNAFSPNGDGINDTYKITGSFVDENTVSKLEVFNRWGTIVYRSKGDTYGKDGKYWDGSSNAGAMVSLGTKLPSGTYFYVFTIDVNIDGEESTKEYSGFIELRR
ncbi:gliding motility-associated C-terminal domain-containing protein, partial [Carboxylicivirga taeanensis]|uniref:T9SS type B sorting domain-containing protein n=1 Tax=Carboxylicivirga taeanensis TaxID=1416875 RepID=UPI003F6DFA2C